MHMLAAIQVNVNVQALAFASGVVIPVLVGLLTKLNASSGVKAALNAFLSAVAGAVIVATQQNGSVDLGHVVIGIAETWVVSVSTYYGFLKPTGAAAAVHKATASFGLGGGTRPAPDVGSTRSF